MKWLSKVVLVICLVFGWNPVSLAATELKIGVLAPEGSTWSAQLNAMGQELETKSGGQLKLKIYYGTQGDESDMIRKMRIGQLHGAGLTGKGLGDLVSSTRLLELPFLTDSVSVIDTLQKNLGPKFSADLEKKGFLLLGWAEAGWVYLMSNHPIKTPADLKGRKMWLYAGDPLAEALYQELGITPVTLSLPQVFTSLQTGMIDTVYAPPLAALALQWYTKVKYITNLPIVDATGALVFTKAAVAKLPAEQQKILRETVAKYAGLLQESTRRENQQALESLRQAGLEVLTVAPADRDSLIKSGRAVWPKMVGKLYTAEQLAEVEKMAGVSH